MILTIAGLSRVAWCLVFRGLRRLSRRAYFKGACDGIEQVSEHLAQAGLDNTWAVGQNKDGVIKLLPMAGEENTEPGRKSRAN